MNRIVLWIFVAAIVTNGCKGPNSGDGQAHVLRLLAHDHPGLAPSSVDAAEFYRPWRKSWTVNSNVEMILFGPPDSMDDGHRMVLFRNETSRSYIGLALPSNASTDYWGFEFDNLVGPIRDTTRFDDELMEVAKALGKADHKSDLRPFFFDLFRGLLMLDWVQESDSANGLVITSTPGLGNDDEKESWSRHDSNWKALADTTYGFGIPSRPYAIIDRGADRIFMLDPKDMYGKGIPRGKIRVFRTGMNVIPIEL